MPTSTSQEHLEALTLARQNTLAALAKVDEEKLLQLTQLTLPQIREVQEEIARMLPAGNLPALILSGLTQIKGRKISTARVTKDLETLFQGMELLPQGLFGVLIGGPSLILNAYQKLLQLSGKDVQSAFPQGTWQFYLEFGLREDTARHANETSGFQAAIPEAENPIMQAAAWMEAAMALIYQYDDLLAIDWRERVRLRTIIEVAQEAHVADQPPFDKLTRAWERARPFRCPPRRSDYLRYRLETFETFIQDRLQSLSTPQQTQVRERFAARQQAELADFLQQMTILSALTPTAYREEKEPIPLWRAAVGFVWQGQTYLFPVCQRNAQGSPLCYPPDAQAPPVPLYTHPEGICDAHENVLDSDRGGRVWYRHSKKPLGNLRAPESATIQGWLQAIFDSDPAPAADLDLLLPQCPRAIQSKLRQQLPKAVQNAVTRLRRAPIIINWDAHDHAQPLARIRRDHRGIGDHALTLFRTSRSMVFDQSHIFFDGMWGMAVAEIMTTYALQKYQALTRQESAPSQAIALTPLALRGTPEVAAKVEESRLPAGAAAESTAIDVGPLLRLRKWLKQRGVRLTVNDLLILYRVLYAPQYTPSARVDEALAELSQRIPAAEYKALHKSIQETLDRFQETNPALLIPMDGSYVSPTERLFPTTFRNPVADLPTCYETARAHYLAYRDARAPETWAAFDAARRQLLSELNYFGEFLDALKALTMRGDSASTVTLRLLGHLPPAMQHLLDQIPQHISVLNEVIKGNEVFSNVGRVKAGSSLTRFISAKDDGATKELVWGILTDDEGTLHVSLRDFRPFVGPLMALNERPLADLLAQDYLDGYVEGFNRFVADLSTVVAKKASST